jgi:predicted MFS family arabinose efflux permease
VRRVTFAILCLEAALLSFNVAATAAVIPSVAKEFALSQFAVAPAVWLYMLPYGVAALMYGPLVRRFDAKNVELVCVLLFSLSNALAACAPVLPVFLTARFLMGATGASVIPLGLILIAREVAPAQRGKMVGLFFAAMFAGSLLGLLLSGILPWRYMYGIPAVFGLLLWGHMIPYMPRFPPARSGGAFQYARAFAYARIRRLFIYIFLISVLYHGIQQWLGIYFSSRWGFSQFTVSMLMTLTSLSGIGGEIAGGFMADRLGRRRTVDYGLVVMVAATCLIIFDIPLWALAGGMLAWGLGWTCNHAGMSTVLTDLPKEFVHEAASLNSSVRFIAGGVGAAAAGMLMQRSFVIGFGVLGAGLLVLLAGSAALLEESD